MENTNKLDFFNDSEKMHDFHRMTKTEFLESYSYITEAEYDATVEVIRDNRIKNANYTKTEVIDVQQPKPFSDFFIRMSPTGKTYENRKEYVFTLMCNGHPYCSVVDRPYFSSEKDAIHYASILDTNYIKTWLEEYEVLDEYYNSEE